MVPAQDGVRGDDRRDLSEDLASELLAFDGESTALPVSQTNALAAELLLEDAIFLDQVLDGLGLMSVDPARERGKEELQGEEIGHLTPIIDL